MISSLIGTERAALEALTIEDCEVKPAARTCYISCVDTAKILRAKLAEAFPGVKFSVRSSSFSGGASITIKYTDGPALYEVERLVAPYKGSAPDKGGDYWDPVYCEVDGVKTHYGSEYISVVRKLSVAFCGRVLTHYAQRFSEVLDSIHVMVYPWDLSQGHFEARSQTIERALALADLQHRVDTIRAIAYNTSAEQLAAGTFGPRWAPTGLAHDS